MKKLLLLITVAVSVPLYGASLDEVKAALEASKALVATKNPMSGSLWPVSWPTKTTAAQNLLLNTKLTGSGYWSGVSIIDELLNNFDEAKLVAQPQDNFQTELIKELLNNVLNAETEEELAVAVDRALSIFVVVGAENRRNPKFRDNPSAAETRLEQLRYAKNREELAEAKINDEIAAALQSSYK
jgi:hypothetical protein